MSLCKLRLCFDYHGSVHAGSLRSRRFLDVNQTTLYLSIKH